MTDLADNDRNKELEELRESARPCFQCGICASSCPVFRVAPEMNPRVSVDSIVTSDEITQDGTEWLCAYCLMCDQRCPMGVSLAEILLGIKNIAAREGKAPVEYVQTAETLVDDGCLSPISSRSEKKRVELGLPDLPRPDPADVQKLFQATGAADVLEINKAAMEEASE
ncbi:MAG: 4Fe-4S dicluster domain-containing protein [Candidatus Thorarchaeota archaeon]|jgi:heterodisulfide reductase subunit C